MHAPPAVPLRRFGGLAAARCGVAAVGACAGGLVAFPVGGLPAAYLFTNVGKSIVDGLVTSGMAGNTVSRRCSSRSCCSWPAS